MVVNVIEVEKKKRKLLYKTANYIQLFLQTISEYKTLINKSFGPSIFEWIQSKVFREFERVKLSSLVKHKVILKIK